MYYGYVGFAQPRKEESTMNPDTDRQITRKAMAYDLHKILDRDPAQATYTKDEVKKLIDVYVETANQN